MLYNDSFFNYILRELAEKGQLELSLHLQRQRLIERINQQQEMEHMKQEIVNEVLSRISIMFETDEALKKIDSLDNAINKLGE